MIDRLQATFYWALARLSLVLFGASLADHESLQTVWWMAFCLWCTMLHHIFNTQWQALPKIHR